LGKVPLPFSSKRKGNYDFFEYRMTMPHFFSEQEVKDVFNRVQQDQTVQQPPEYIQMLTLNEAKENKQE
jgi:hypothetical protein